jgi:hypothetical protein
MIRANGSRLGKAASRNTYNRSNATSAKLDIRRNTLQLVQPAHVFDAFCGPTGEMWREVWSQAARYVGCDTEYEMSDQRRRFVADNRRVLRCVDLSEFNVFDFDAFGSPWSQMLILLERRHWSKDERGAVILTDGSSGRTRFGGMPIDLAQLVGCEREGLAPTAGSAEAMQSIALTVWCKRARVQPFKMWQAKSRSSGVGAQAMTYTALVFDGLGGA